MKKQLLTLGLAFLGAGLIYAVADPNESATNTDSARAATTIYWVDDVATLDGDASDAVWSEDAVPVQELNRPFRGETPSLYSASWKGFWNDTAIFILVEASDDCFWPSWLSGQPDWASDKVELYFGANGIVFHGGSPSVGGNAKGYYQITNNYDTIEAMGDAHAGGVAGTWQANTWAYTDPTDLVVEWMVPLTSLKDSDGLALDPLTRPTIQFDVCVVDLDSTTTARQRQVWSNIAVVGESWNTMDSCGALTLDEWIGVTEVTAGNAALVQPTVVTDVLYSNVSEISIYNALGQLVLTSKDSQVNVGNLSKGVYIVTGKINNKTLSQRILKN